MFEFIKQLEAIDRGISLWWRTIGKARGFTHHACDIEWISSAGHVGPERIFNVRLSSETTESRIDEIASAMRTGALPGSMLLTPLSLPVNIVDLMAQRSFNIDDSSPCMALEPAGFCATPLSGQNRLAAVEDEQSLRVWAEIVNNGLFGCELFSFNQYADLYRLDSTRFYIAYLADSPASACMTIHEEDFATLECVATLPEFRRRGLGTAVVSHALEKLKELEISIISLRSEPDGVNLYKRLGFQEYCKRIVASVGS